MADSTTKPHRKIIVVGSASGGVAAMLALCRALPMELDAPILVALDIDPRRRGLAELMVACAPHKVVIPANGQALEAGAIYIAPPDFHMLVGDGVVWLSKSAREHGRRPAIDPLFRSAALHYGPRAMGVVLTGALDDGAAGLRAIKQCGGTTVAQDPTEASEPSMPRAAISAAAPDHVAPLARMPELFARFAALDLDGSHQAPDELKMEQLVARGVGSVRALQSIAQPSPFSCPDCGGVLFELNDKSSTRFRCHTGHAYSLRSLAHTQSHGVDAALWAGLRGLQEKEALLRRVAADSEDRLALDALMEANELTDISDSLRDLLDRLPRPRR